MPLPKTKSVKKIIEFLNKEKPTMPKKQKIAIALNVARGGKKYGKGKKSVDKTTKTKTKKSPKRKKR
ncbi:MAG: hypothetical protein GYA14_11775 [Ignavibacteria bacterium]|nr:hypothetical protein [Ignavibacteria bacterium]